MDMGRGRAELRPGDPTDTGRRVSRRPRGRRDRGPGEARECPGWPLGEARARLAQGTALASFPGGLRLSEGPSSAGRVAPARPFRPRGKSPDTSHGSALRQRPCTLASRFQSPEHAGAPAAAACAGERPPWPLRPPGRAGRQPQPLLAEFSVARTLYSRLSPSCWTRSWRVAPASLHLPRKERPCRHRPRPGAGSPLTSPEATSAGAARLREVAGVPEPDLSLPPRAHLTVVLPGAEVRAAGRQGTYSAVGTAPR